MRSSAEESVTLAASWTAQGGVQCGACRSGSGSCRGLGTHGTARRCRTAFQSTHMMADTGSGGRGLQGLQRIAATDAQRMLLWVLLHRAARRKC